MTGKPMSEWLNKITDDQNLNDLDEVTSTRLDGLRRWFASRVLGFNINTGYFNPFTGKTVLGGMVLNDPNLLKDVVSNNDTSSVASKEWTATGNGWIVLGASFENQTRAPALKVEITPAGGSATPICNSNGHPQSDHITLYGMYNATTGSNMGFAPPQLLVLDVGDKIKITDETFVAADNTDYWIWYIQL